MTDILDPLVVAAELREAAVLAAAMHEAETIRPLLVARMRPVDPWDYR